MTDILSEYERIITRHLDAPTIFIKASSYFIVSSLLGRFFRCAHIPGSPEVGMRPNIWFIISSIPGRTRRSTVANYSTHVYKKCLCNYFQETVPDWSDLKKARQKVQDSIIEEGTAEGIADHLSTTNLDSYSILSSEFGSVLTRINTKEYQEGVSSLLSKLYYGEGHSMLLSQKRENPMKRYIPDNLYVVLFAGMQEPKNYLSPIMIRQGLLRRIDLIYCAPSDIDRWLPPIQIARGSVYEDLKQLIDIINKKMIEYKEIAEDNIPSLIDTSFAPVAYRYINDIAEKNDKELQKNPTNYNIYKQGFWENLAKLSMVQAISRDGLHKIEQLNELFVTLNDVKVAETFLVDSYKYSAEIIAGLSRVDVPIKDATAPLEKIFNLVLDAGEKGIVRSDLSRKSNMTTTEMDQYLTTLQVQNKVIKITDVSTGGRCPTVYKTVS